jgi:hypothetical protein
VRSLGGDRLTLASYYSMSDEKLCDKIGPTTCHVSRTTCLCRCCCCRECVCRSSAVPPIDCNQVAGLYLGMLVVRLVACRSQGAPRRSWLHTSTTISANSQLCSHQIAAVSMTAASGDSSCSHWEEAKDDRQQKDRSISISLFLASEQAPARQLPRCRRLARWHHSLLQQHCCSAASSLQLSRFRPPQPSRPPPPPLLLLLLLLQLPPLPKPVPPLAPSLSGALRAALSLPSRLAPRRLPLQWLPLLEMQACRRNHHRPTALPFG